MPLENYPIIRLKAHARLAEKRRRDAMQALENGSRTDLCEPLTMIITHLPPYDATSPDHQAVVAALPVTVEAACIVHVESEVRVRDTLVRFSPPHIELVPAATAFAIVGNKRDVDAFVVLLTLAR